MSDIPAHLRRILDLARWAPSGDNTQPWRFEILGDEYVLVHGFDTRDHVVYDLDGHASQLAVGALLETISIVATAEGRRAHIARRRDTPETHLLIDVRFEQDTTLNPDTLVSFIEKRVVQRRSMSTQTLTSEQKHSLSLALPEGFQIVWFEGFTERLRLARFMFDNAKVRLIIPEGYQVHRSVIEWGARFSEDKIPSRAVGVDSLTERFMHWAMASWERVEFLNTWLFGDLPPRLQLDLIPGIFCAGHFALLAPKFMQSVDDYISAGRAMQRFWLVVASLGLYLQPEMTPLIFARYYRQTISFTRVEAARARVGGLDARLRSLFPDKEIEALFFMGRIGAGPAPRARSTRKPLESLIVGSR